MLNYDLIATRPRVTRISRYWPIHHIKRSDVIVNRGVTRSCGKIIRRLVIEITSITIFHHSRWNWSTTGGYFKGWIGCFVKKLFIFLLDCLFRGIMVVMNRGVVGWLCIIIPIAIVCNNGSVSGTTNQQTRRPNKEKEFFIHCYQY